MGDMFAVIGIPAAINERHATGRGRLVKAGLFENNIFLVAQHMAQFAVTGKPAPPMPARISAWAVYDVFATADDDQVFVGVVSDSQWAVCCREKVLAGLEKAHSRVSGELEDGTRYNAMEPARQLWVLATLTDTVIEVDRRYLGKMNAADRAVYYDESKVLAEAFGIPSHLVPEDYDAFRDYFAEQVATLEPTDASRDITRDRSRASMLS